MDLMFIVLWYIFYTIVLHISFCPTIIANGYSSPSEIIFYGSDILFILIFFFL